MWSETRGIFKGKMTEETYYWEDATGCETVKDEYKEVTWVNINDQIYLRSSHLPNEPFLPLDREACKIKENYESFTSEDNRLNWSSCTENSSIYDAARGYRYLRAT